MVRTRSSSKRGKGSKGPKKEVGFGGYTAKGETLYELEVIRKARKRNGIYEYFVQWVGYSKEYNSWEPHENLEDIERSNGKKCYEAPPDWIQATIVNYRRTRGLPLQDKKKVRKRKKYF